ncbi:MAG: type II toxin-antitoxin system VapB family antitoxin [Acidobacteria bacterium]|nr:type II toxin-antitoxin system VapB family antitoxin [Acidobacteriota bacterium]
MGLNIKNAEVERLAAEVAAMTGESKTEAIRKALLERKESLSVPQRQRMDGVREWLEREVWPLTKPEFRGKPVTKEEMDALWE